MKPYRGYTGKIEYDPDDKVFHGRINNIDATITFAGDSREKAEQAFRESVDTYLQWAEEDGFEPEKTRSGRLALRVTPSLHRRLAAAADRANVSLSQFVVRTLDEAVRPRWRSKVPAGKPRAAKAAPVRRRAAV